MKNILKLLYISLLSVTLFSCSNETTKVNPCEASFITEDTKNMLNNVKRVDDDGYLYFLDYTYDYYDETILNGFKNSSGIKVGCSAFTAYNSGNQFLMCRNYDYRHNDSNKNLTGLNIILNTSPKDKLKSIAICDAFWLNQTSFFNGTLDDGKTDISNLIFAPYSCVDGFNEAGVSGALLALDTKPGETATNQETSKEKVNHSILLRYIFDNAHNLEEAIDIAKQYDMFSTQSADIHMILADKSGVSAVLEWRQFEGDEAQKLYVTYTNAVTNFYVGFDDGVDMYNADGSLRENLVKISGSKNTYHYGYGHGYHRFNGIISGIDRYILNDTVANKYGVKNATMLDYQTVEILSEAAQEAGVEKTSLTQYSVIYNMETLSFKIYSWRNYLKSYQFSLLSNTNIRVRG